MLTKHTKLLPGYDRQDVLNAVLDPIPHKTRFSMSFCLIQALQWVCACLETWMSFNRPYKRDLFLLRGAIEADISLIKIVRFDLYSWSFMISLKTVCERRSDSDSMCYCSDGKDLVGCNTSLRAASWCQALNILDEMRSAAMASRCQGTDAWQLWHLTFPMTWQLHLVNWRLCRYERKTMENR